MVPLSLSESATTEANASLPTPGMYDFRRNFGLRDGVGEIRLLSDLFSGFERCLITLIGPWEPQSSAVGLSFSCEVVMIGMGGVVFKDLIEPS